MRWPFLFLFVGALSVAGACSSLGSSSAARLTVTPVENDGMHERNVMLAERAGHAKDTRLVFVGDSITQGWESEPDLWNAEFGRYAPLNLGVSGDRTEHVLWRLETGAYDGLKPEAIVIMIGTNNTGHRMDEPEPIANGIDTILGQLAARFPRARLVLLAIFPRDATVDDPMRRNNAAVNALLPKIAAKRGAEWLDLSGSFLDGNGVLHESVMPDLLHLSSDGYVRWATALREPLARWMR